MDISRKWLSDYVKLDCDDAYLCDKLTMAGIEVEKVEKNFRNSRIYGEAVLLHAVSLDRLNKSADALTLLTSLHDNRDLSVAAESLLRTGEIYFRQGKLTEARQAFTRSAAMQKGSLNSDIAMGRAGDCILAGKSPLAAENITECTDIFTSLAQNSKFPQIRLQSFVKAGIALEHAGKNREALEYYEKAVYTAIDMVESGIIPDPQWCVRGCESALRLIAKIQETGALQHGLRLIDRCGQLMLPEADFTEKMRKNFRQQLQQRR